MFDQSTAEAYSRAIELGCVKDRGVKKTVKKIENAGFTFNDQLGGSKLSRYFLNEAKQKNDPTFLLRIYTVEGIFYRELNHYMADGGKTKVYQKLCGRWSGYYAGVIMKNPTFQKYHFSGKTYRGMEVTNEDLEQYKLGVILANKAFQSTSKSRQIAFDFAHPDSPKSRTIPVIMIYGIRDPKSALDVSSLSEYPDEEEVLIVPGSLFKVHSINKSSTGYEVHLRQELWSMK